MTRRDGVVKLMKFVRLANDYASIIFWLCVVYIGFATLNGGYWEDHSVAWAILVGSGITMVVSYFAKETDSILELIFQSIVFPLGVFLFLLFTNWRA